MLYTGRLFSRERHVRKTIATFLVSSVISTLCLCATGEEGPGRSLAGTVYLDQNDNGVRDRGEPAVPGARVSDQAQTVLTGPEGRWTIAQSRGFGVVFVGAPAGYRPRGSFWVTVGTASDRADLDFPLRLEPASRSFTFLHGSDCHVSASSIERLRTVRSLVEGQRPAFVLMTGDLVRDALRVGEKEATGYYDLYVEEIARFPVPVWSVPGNHEIFAIERHQSLVGPSHPLYAKGMYRQRLGPNYYSFDLGGIHFVALDTVDIDDLWYYGHVDAAQLDWFAGDLATVPATTPVVTFNHIPLVTAVEMIAGFRGDPPAPSLITVNGKTQYRHVVANTAEVLDRIKGHPYPLALGGHMHTRESLRYEAEGVVTRFHQAAAIVGPSDAGPFHMRSGVTLYRVENGQIDDGTFLPLDR